MKKRVFATLVLLIVTIGAVAGLYVYLKREATRTKFDLAKNISVEFEGVDGSGTIASISNSIQYDKSDLDLASFMNSLEYDCNQSDNLKNNQEIDVQVLYDEDEAKKLDLQITNNIKSVKVKGLYGRYKKASNIPDTVINEARINAIKAVDEYYQNDDAQVEFHSLWFRKQKQTETVKNNDSKTTITNYINDNLCAVFKVTKNGETTYVRAFYEEFDERYAKDPNLFTWQIHPLTDSNQQILRDEKIIKNAVTNTLTVEKPDTVTQIA